MAMLAMAVHCACAAERKPNIIFILADDLGYSDLSSYGSTYYETPNIDRLAKEGMKFTDGYTNGSNCQPTRAALISGQYAPRTGVYTVGDPDRFDWQSQAMRPVHNNPSLPLDKITIAQALKSAGYTTGMFGKWHLGNKGELLPAHRGFDEAIASNGRHFDFFTIPKTPYKKGTYLADFLTDKSVEFIERHKEQPFFLYLSHYGVHSPHHAKENLIAKFKDKPGSKGHNNPVYAAMIASIDESVGRVIEKIDELGLAEDTLIIFSSDNGGVGSYKSNGVEAGEITDNSPLRGGKGMFYEGGIRVPYLFRWKSVVPAGIVSDQPIASIDLYPTALEMAGASAPKDYTLDGESYLSHLKSPDKRLKRDSLYWHFPGYLGSPKNTWRAKPCSVIRSGSWKLIQSLEDQSLQLFNLKDDIGETRDLASSQPEKAAELLAKLDTWRKDIRAPFPVKNESPRPPGTSKKSPKAKTE